MGFGRARVLFNCFFFYYFLSEHSLNIDEGKGQADDIIANILRSFLRIIFNADNFLLSGTMNHALVCPLKKPISEMRLCYKVLLLYPTHAKPFIVSTNFIRNVIR